MMKHWLVSLWQNPRMMNACAGLLLGIALAVAGLAAVNWVKRHSVFNIKEIVVTGMRGEQDLTHQNPAFIRQAIVRQLRGNLFTLELNEVQNAFAQAPWVRHISVRRVWPNRLWVVLEEHQAVATLNDEYLVNQQGEAYMAVLDDSPTEQAASVRLPALQGDVADAALLLQRYRDLNLWLGSNKATVSPVTVSRLFLSERRSWTAVLTNGVTLEIGRDDLKPEVPQRVTQWVKSWATAEQQTVVGSNAGVAVLNATNKARSHVDLRYPNGYAISRSVRAD